MPSWAWVILALVVAATGFVVGLPWLIQPLMRLMLSARYRFRMAGLENLPRTGPALLVSNHVTWFDGFIVAATCPRRGKALVNGAYIDAPIFGFLARRAGLIPVYYRGPRAQRAMFQACRDTLDQGEVVAIFAEGQITRNGLTGPFQRGLEVIVSGRDEVPVIPVFLDNMWGSLLSYSGGRFFKKWPQGLRRTVNIVYGPPVPPPVTAFKVRQATVEAGVRAFAMRTKPSRPLETLDPKLPHLDHPTLGPLTGSTADYDRGEVRHIGHKEGTVGVALPGVALRVVDEANAPLPPDTEGRLEALIAGRTGWADVGCRAKIDRSGFVTLTSPEGSGEATAPASVH